MKSTPQTTTDGHRLLAYTLADAARLHLRVARLPTLHDVDSAPDLARWRG